MAKTAAVYSFGTVAKNVARSWELALYVLLHIYDTKGSSVAGNKRARSVQAGIDLPKDLRTLQHAGVLVVCWRASLVQASRPLPTSPSLAC